ncbi:MAG: radical SAM protein [Candidatus Omnitrophica bacterium]|nr:radical SAM protein [Candidatus Omnitrophota bacterium]
MILTKKRKAKLFKLFRARQLPYLPYSLGIDPGNICNLKCPLCPTGLGDSGAQKSFLEFSLFKLVFDQLKESLSEINMFNWGEPLLNKDLTKMIRYAKEVKPLIYVITSTNLNINNDNLLEEVMNSGIDKIIVSCDGTTKESYGKYRVGGDFGLVMRNLRFLAEKNSKLARKVLIVWNFIVFKHNEHEVEIVKKMSKDIGVDCNIGLMRTSLKDEILKPHHEGIAKDMDLIPDNPIYSAYDKCSLTVKKVLKTCKKPWQSIAVNSNGLVFPCCAVYEEKYSFGDVKKDSIKDIWNNRKFVLARQEILNKKRPACTICGTCRNNGFMHM